MSLSCSLQPSRGFHFNFSTNISSNLIRPECDLYLLHVFPSDVFIDKYELKELGLVYNLYGESNLELPLAAVEPVGSTLEVHVSSGILNINIPLHARYPLPSTTLHSTVRIPEPQAYWACSRSGEFETNPFSHLVSPYVPSLDLNALSFAFYDLDNAERYHEIQVPTGRHADIIFVKFGTVLVVLAAFVYILREIWLKSKRRPLNLKHE